MNRKKRFLICGLYAMLLLLYPEALLDNTMIRQSGNVRQEENVYLALWKARPEEIKIKSRLVEWWNEVIRGKEETYD